MIDTSIQASTNRRSRLAVLVAFIAIVTIRWVTIEPIGTIAWDIFGYYLYVPSVLIHGDLSLDDITWIVDAQQTYSTTETLYQITDAPDGSRMFFFLMGMSILYAPFFLVGHFLAFMSEAPMDGFSGPYLWSLALGCTLYSLIGLLFLRRILLRYFSDSIAALVILIIVFGTNYFQFSTVKNLETANFLFTGVAWLVWSTIRWHSTYERRHLLQIAAAIALITLIKPSEIICGLVPLLWGVHDRASLHQKIRALTNHRTDLVLAIAVGLAILSPQLIYWKWKTGAFIYDSYRNPGVGLDLLSPHVWNTLFSFRKGWLIYTPIMILALAGILRLRKAMPEVFLPLVTYGLIAFWIISSWSEWWYGASFSIRPMITLYPLLAIPMALLLDGWRRSPRSFSIGGGALITSLVALNLFQTWQLNEWIIHPYRTTAAYYWKVFGRTTLPPGTSELLLVERRFDAKEVLLDPSPYTKSPVIGAVRASPTETLTESRPFLPIVEKTYKEITSADHFWAKASVEVLVPEHGNAPVLVVRMERKEGGYGERIFEVPDTVPAGKWGRIQGDFMTPEIRSRNDRFKVYVWNRGGDTALVRDPVVDLYLPKETP